MSYKIEGRPPTIFRVVKSPDNPFVMVDRRPIDNRKLSFKAKGILTYLLSRPDGWEVNVTDLINHSTDKEAAVRSGLKELKNAGHMRYIVIREAGRIIQWKIEVHEAPHSDFQQVEIQDVENRTQLISKRSSKKQKKGKREAAEPQKAPTPPEILLYREVTKRYPPKENWDDVVKSIQLTGRRLGRECTVEDLMPFRKAWTGKGYNPLNLAWLEWAETGMIPSSTNWKSQKFTEPKAFNAVRQFMEES